jgi:hypothetical protein
MVNFKLSVTKRGIFLTYYKHAYKICTKYLFIRKQLHMLKNGAFWDVTPCGSCKNRCSSQRASVASCS